MKYILLVEKLRFVYGIINIKYNFEGDNMAFYITGDCHRNFRKTEIFCRYNNTSKKDYMIVLGNAGINFYMDESDKELKRRLSDLPIRFLMVHGNHEERPFRIRSYVEREWQGGSVYVEEEFPDLLFAKDGEIYDFDGKKGMAIGGAYSIDKEYRLRSGIPWFETEQPSKEIKQYVEEQLEKAWWQVDYVFSHTAPRSMEPTDLFLKLSGMEKVDKSTEDWLERICKNLSYQKWYFGHYHENRIYQKAEMLFEEIKELGAEDFLQRIGRPKYQLEERVGFIWNTGNEQVKLYGKIVVVDAYGTLFQTREVSYDIQVGNTWYKYIKESEII